MNDPELRPYQVQKIEFF